MVLSLTAVSPIETSLTPVSVFLFSSGGILSGTSGIRSTFWPRSGALHLLLKHLVGILVGWVQHADFEEQIQKALLLREKFPGKVGQWLDFIQFFFVAKNGARGNSGRWFGRMEEGAGCCVYDGGKVVERHITKKGAETG